MLFESRTTYSSDFCGRVSSIQERWDLRGHETPGIPARVPESSHDHPQSRQRNGTAQGLLTATTARGRKAGRPSLRRRAQQSTHEEEDPHPPSRTSHPIWLMGLSQATCNMPAVEERATVRISSPIDEEPHPASPSKTDCQVWNKTLGSRLPTSQYPSVQCGAQYPHTSLCYPRIRRRSALRRSTLLLISLESKLVHVATTTSINKRGEQR